MTPAETLRAAADRLDGLKRWEIADLDEWQAGVSEKAPVAAAWLRVLARTPRPLYAWLNRMAAEYTPGDEFVSRQTNDALAVARAVLGESS